MKELITETSKVNRMAYHLRAFIFLSNRKRVFIHFTMLIDQLKTSSVYYQDTDSLYINETWG